MNQIITRGAPSVKWFGSFYIRSTPLVVRYNSVLMIVLKQINTKGILGWTLKAGTDSFGRMNH